MSKSQGALLTSLLQDELAEFSFPTERVESTFAAYVDDLLSLTSLPANVVFTLLKFTDPRAAQDITVEDVQKIRDENEEFFTPGLPELREPNLVQNESFFPAGDERIQMSVEDVGDEPVFVDVRDSSTGESVLAEPPSQLNS